MIFFWNNVMPDLFRYLSDFSLQNLGDPETFRDDSLSFPRHSEMFRNLPGVKRKPGRP